MRKVILAVVMMLGLAAAASAQTPTSPISKLAWDITDTDAATAAASTYRLYVDALAPVQLTEVTCSGSAPVVCTAQVPALTQGQHSATVTRTVVVSGTPIESPKSNSVEFLMVLVAAPMNLRVAPNVP